MNARLLILLIAAASPSCTSLQAEYGRRPRGDESASLMPGTSGRADVLRELGAPHQIARQGAGCVFAYERVVVQENQLAITLHRLTLGLVKFSAGRSTAQHEVLLLEFDQTGLLVGVGSGSWSNQEGRGAGLQTFHEVIGVVESGDLQRHHVALSWGRIALSPLPSLLNQPHRADLSLRGTPHQFGQFSLEQLDWRTEEF